jgi:hypothetical protein
MKYVYIVIELSGDTPKICGVFKNPEDAEKEAYKDMSVWRNIVKEKVR